LFFITREVTMPKKNLFILPLLAYLTIAVVQAQPAPNPLTSLERIDPAYAHAVLHFAGQCGIEPNPKLFSAISTDAHFIAVKKAYEAIGSQAPMVRLPNALPDFCKRIEASGGAAASNAPARPAPRLMPSSPEMMLQMALTGQGMLVGAPGAPSPAVAPSERKAVPANYNPARREIKGINDWSGYMVGTPSGDGLFDKVEIGMSSREVWDRIGMPNDSSMHATGKNWIPYFAGSGKTESWYYYKGTGRLLLASDGGQSGGRFYVIAIEHDAEERGYKP
jgi:hypothetical protein